MTRNFIGHTDALTPLDAWQQSRKRTRRNTSLVAQCSLAGNVSSKENIAELSDESAGACSTCGGLIVRQRTDAHAFAYYSLLEADRLSVLDAGRKTDDIHDGCQRSEIRIRCLGR